MPKCCGKSCSNCLEVLFWPITGVIFILVTSILVGVELPWATEAPVVPVYNAAEISEAKNKRYQATNEIPSSEEMNIDIFKLLNAFDRMAEKSENLLREQYIRGWKKIVSKMEESRDFYQKHYDDRGAQKDELELYNSLIEFYNINRGPYDIVEGMKAFITKTHRTSFPKEMLPGHNFYSDKLTKDGWEQMITDDQELRDPLNSKYEKAKEKCYEAEEEYNNCISNSSEGECEGENNKMSETCSDRDNAFSNLDEFNRVEKSLLAPFAVVGDVPRNEYGMYYEAFSYDIEYEDYLSSILEEINEIDENTLSRTSNITEYFFNMKKIYEKILEDGGEEINNGDSIIVRRDHYNKFVDVIHNATISWCKMNDDNIEFLFGPYNFGFDELNGRKRSWCSYAGFVDKDWENVAEKYLEYLENTRKYEESYLPKVRPINLLIEQEGKVAPPKTLSFTIPSLEDMANGYIKMTETRPKSYVFVNQIKLMYDKIIRNLMDRIALGSSSDNYQDAYIQLFISLEFARSSGIDLSNLQDQEEDIIVVTSESYAINYIKSILSGIHDIFSSLDYEGIGDIMKCTTDINITDEISCDEFADQMFKVAITQLIYVMQFDNTSPYYKYAEIVLSYLQNSSIIEFGTGEGSCTVSVNEDCFNGDNMDNTLNVIEELIIKLASVEQGADEAELFRDVGPLSPSCAAVFQEGDVRVLDPAGFKL